MKEFFNKPGFFLSKSTQIKSNTCIYFDLLTDSEPKIRAHFFLLNSYLSIFISAGLSYTLLDQVFSSISLDQDFYEKVIPGVGFQSPLLVWIKIFPRNLVQFIELVSKTLTLIVHKSQKYGAKNFFKRKDWHP